ncbi:MAG: SdpI family protein [Bacillota bacterium]
MKINKWLMVVMILSFIATIVVYSSLPDSIPRHWNVKGEVDRYGGKGGVFVTALLPLGIMLLAKYLPKIDPKKASYEKHGKAYTISIEVIALFMVLMHWITVAAAMGYNINVGAVVRAGIGVLFIVLGNYMSQIRPNYFFGIKTPWTLANEQVWKQTHRVGGYAFVISGLITVGTIFMKEELAFIVMLVSLFVLLAYTFLYSYLTYRKIVKN